MTNAILTNHVFRSIFCWLTAICAPHTAYFLSFFLFFHFFWNRNSFHNLHSIYLMIFNAIIMSSMWYDTYALGTRNKKDNSGSIFFSILHLYTRIVKKSGRYVGRFICFASKTMKAWCIVLCIYYFAWVEKLRFVSCFRQRKRIWTRIYIKKTGNDLNPRG